MGLFYCALKVLSKLVILVTAFSGLAKSLRELVDHFSRF